MSTRHWKRLPLSAIAEVRLGRQRSPKRAVGPNMRPYMRAANVTWNGISLHDVKEMDFTPEEFKSYALRRGDLLLSEASGSVSEVGKPAVWNDEVRDCCFQNTLIRVRAPEALVPFLHLHFYKDALTGEFARAARGVGIHHLGARTLAEWEIRLPPLDEQRRIVETINSYFTHLDDVVATLERVRRNLKRYRASILKAAVEGRLVPTEATLAGAEGRDYEPATVLLDRILAARQRRWEETELEKMKAAGKTPKNDTWKARYQEPTDSDTTTLPLLPEGWCWATIDQLGDVTGGLTQNSKRRDLPVQVPFLRVANVYADEIRLGTVKEVGVTESERQRAHLVAGDLLIVEGNGSIDQIGRVALWNAAISPCVHQNHLIRVRFEAVVLARWTLGWLLSPSGRIAIEQAASSTSGLHTLSLSKVRRLPVPLPPLAEQARVTQAADEYRDRAKTLEQMISLEMRYSDSLRQSIVDCVFRGGPVESVPRGSGTDQSRRYSTLHAQEFSLPRYPASTRNRNVHRAD